MINYSMFVNTFGSIGDTWPGAESAGGQKKAAHPILILGVLAVYTSAVTN